MVRRPLKTHRAKISSSAFAATASDFVQIPLSQVPRRETFRSTRTFVAGALVDRVLSLRQLTPTESSCYGLGGCVHRLAKAIATLAQLAAQRIQSLRRPRGTLYPHLTPAASIAVVVSTAITNVATQVPGLKVPTGKNL
jgi:hypothetical protein